MKIRTLGFVAATLVAFGLLGPGSALAKGEQPDCDAAAQAVKAELDAACPCDAAGGHAEHVRCVTKKLRDLTACAPSAQGKKACGTVPRVCAAKIRRVAARSACGKPAGMVTCCVPKQRDCAGDATPGDGTKSGTCTGTDRACDVVADCMIPRCELAATAERCTLIGGTVGRGRDCASACE
jgi:hypothetical protein